LGADEWRGAWQGCLEPQGGSAQMDLGLACAMRDVVEAQGGMTRAVRLAGLNRERLGVQPGHSVKVSVELSAVAFEIGLGQLPLVRPDGPASSATGPAAFRGTVWQRGDRWRKSQLTGAPASSPLPVFGRPSSRDPRMRELRPNTKLLGNAQHVIASTLEINVLAGKRPPLLYRALLRGVARRPEIDRLAANQEVGLAISTTSRQHFFHRTAPLYMERHIFLQQCLRR
jgi:hypothetical protein